VPTISSWSHAVLLTMFFMGFIDKMIVIWLGACFPGYDLSIFDGEYFIENGTPEVGTDGLVVVGDDCYLVHF
jgi:hypothetical protein